VYAYSASVLKTNTQIICYTIYYCSASKYRWFIVSIVQGHSQMGGQGSRGPKLKCCLALLRTNNEKFQILGWILADICLKCIILVAKVQNRQVLVAFHSQHPFNPRFGNLKLRYLAKFCFSNNFKIISHNVISVTSSLLRHQTDVKIFSILGTPNQNFWQRLWCTMWKFHNTVKEMSKL